MEGGRLDAETAMVKRKPVTAAELMDRLNRDPAYLARVAERDARLAEFARIRDQVAAPVLADLRSLGYQVDDILDLPHSGRRYNDAVPLLAAWLPRVSEPWVKEMIVRALSVPWGRPAAPELIREFRTSRDEDANLRWAIGNALSVVADEALRDDLLELALDRRFGTGRKMVVLGLGKMKKSSDVVVPPLIGLLEDEEVAGHAVMALGMLRAKDAREAVEALRNHPKAWVRAEVRKALVRMDK